MQLIKYIAQILQLNIKLSSILVVNCEDIKDGQGGLQ